MRRCCSRILLITLLLAPSSPEIQRSRPSRCGETHTLSPRVELSPHALGIFLDRQLTDIEISEPTQSPYGDAHESSAQLSFKEERLPFNIPWPFPKAIHGARGENEPEWLQSSLLAQLILRLRHQYGEAIPLSEFLSQTPGFLRKYRMEVDRNQIIILLNGLRRRGLISSGGDYDFAGTTAERIYVTTAPRTIAIWADDYQGIRDDLRAALEQGEHVFLHIIQRYAQKVSYWNQYPVEAQYPVLRAISQLTRAEQEKIVRFLAAKERVRAYPLVDAILLLLTFDMAKTNWIQRHAPYLVDVPIYLVAAEISLFAGGLGRVMQFHGTKMHALGADTIYVEAHYRKERTLDGSARELDYAKLPIPIQNIQKINRFFTTRVQGEDVAFEISVGTNPLGIPVYLIRDAGGYYVNILYEYGTEESPVSNEVFSEFLAKASLELIRFLEVGRKRALGIHYKAPVIDANDGQCLMLNSFLKVFYSDKEKILRDASTSEEDITLAHEVLTNALASGTTHTYRNRQTFGDFNYGLTFLRNAGIPDDMLWTYLRQEFNGSWYWDLTSGGLRSSDFQKGVAAIHAYEMNARDPSLNLLGITNGDLREYSAEFFNQFLEKVKTHDPDLSLGEQVLRAKQLAKKSCAHQEVSLGLNPQQLVVGYIGRLVKEKAGRDRAFTEENIEAWVKRGIQVVYYGNLQASHESKSLEQDLHRIAERIQKAGHPGRFIFRSKFNINDQRQLLAAMDVQIQDSDRYTGAAEYTESDITACGGWQMGPPYWEGIIQKQGAPLNWDTLEGNTLVPQSSAPHSYRALIALANEKFIAEPKLFGESQARSLEFSRVLDASLTAAAYLRAWNTAMRDHTQNRKLLKPRVLGEISLRDISVVAQDTNNIPLNLEREGNTFHTAHSERQVKDMQVNVSVSLTTQDMISKKIQEIPLEEVSVTLVNDYGIRIPLQIKERNIQVLDEVMYVSYLPPELPLPFHATIEITSGLWKQAYEISIITNSLPQHTITYADHQKMIGQSI